MNNSCPISLNKANENIARLNAIFTVIVLILFLITSLNWFILFLALDFFIRGFYNPRNSILSITNIYLTNIFKITPKEIDAAPKIFAAKIGFILCLIIGVLSILHLKSEAYIFTGIMLFCASLEGFFGFCVGCKLYALKENLLLRRDH